MQETRRASASSQNQRDASEVRAISMLERKAIRHHNNRSIDNGRFNVVIGIAQTRPTEFVIIRIGAFAQCRICYFTLTRRT